MNYTGHEQKKSEINLQWKIGSQDFGVRALHDRNLTTTVI